MMPADQARLQELRKRYSYIAYSTLCDPGCEGRCRACPADLVQDLFDFVETIAGPTPPAEGPTRAKRGRGRRGL